jgi:hypothetical protein
VKLCLALSEVGYYRVSCSENVLQSFDVFFLLFEVFYIYLPMVCRKFLEPDRRFKLKVDSGARDFDVRDGCSGPLLVMNTKTAAVW